MFRAKRVILVNAPVDQVFDYLTDFDRHGEWDGDSDLKVVRSSAEKAHVGYWCERSAIRHTIPLFGLRYTKPEERRFRKHLTVTKLRDNEELQFRVFMTDRADELISIQLEPADRGALITQTSRVLLSERWLFSLLLLPVNLVLLPVKSLQSIWFGGGNEDWPINSWAYAPTPVIFNGWYLQRRLNRIRSVADSSFEPG